MLQGRRLWLKIYRNSYDDDDARIVAVCLNVCAAFHELSVYPKKELPFFILFTAGLCSFTALLALLTYQYPEPMGLIAKTVSSVSYS